MKSILLKRENFCMNKEKKGLYALLSLPFVLVGYGLYMFIYYMFFWGQLMTMTMQMDILISIPWQLAIAVSLFMPVPIYYFHKRTKGVLIGYGEVCFFLIMVIYGGYLYISKQGIGFANSEKQTCMLFFEITLIITSILYKKEKEWKFIFRFFQIMKIFFCFMIGLAVYFSVCFIGAFTPWFTIIRNGVVIILSIYIFVLLWISKGKWNGKMIASYGIYIVQEWNIGSPILSREDYLGQLIKDLMPNLEMYFAYGISILAGEILSWGCRRQQGGDNEKEK